MLRISIPLSRAGRADDFPNAQRDSATGSASAVSWPPLVVVFGDMSALEAQALDCTVLDKVGVGSDLHICGLSWLAVAEQFSDWLLTHLLALTSHRSGKSELQQSSPFDHSYVLPR